MKPRHLIPVGCVLAFSIVSAVAKPVEKSLAGGQQEQAAVAAGKNVAGPAEPRATATSVAAAERGVAAHTGRASCCYANACMQGLGPGIRQRAGRGAPAVGRTDAAEVPERLGRGRRMGMAMGGGAGAGRSPVGDAGPGRARLGGVAQVTQAFQQLLTDHAKIKRTVENVPGGVVTVTTSEDPVVAATIRAHVRQMKKRLETGQPLRMWDPLFVELFRHHDQIEMEIEDIPGGVKVTETSQDTHVTLLIRQHARRGVSEFVARGWDRAHEPTPLPDGYGD